MPGGADPLYVLARRALLDGLEALEPHLGSVVVVGAQAVYLHTGPADLPVAEYTTDADLAIAPEFLADEPSIQTLFEERGFELQEDPGKWKTSDGIQVDLLVPDAVAGPGRRGARLPGHGKRAARRARGIEGALVDNDLRTITALDPGDTRSFEVKVAGPAALLVAKIHKIGERIDQSDRLVALVTRRRPWDEEADAADRLAATLGGKATRRDVAGAPAGTHDYDRVIALEVTQHAVGPILAQRALEEKLDWSFDELTFCWSVNVREPCDLHRLRSEIVDVLQTFEADGRDRWLANQSAEDAALDRRLQRQGVKLIYRLTDTTPGEVLVGSIGALTNR